MASLAGRIFELEAELARLKRESGDDVGTGRGGVVHRRQHRLSTRFVETVKEPGLYGDGGNLFLRVRPSGRYWIFRYKRANRARDKGLGVVPVVTLAEARELAIDCRRKLRAGIDPIDEQKSARLAKQLERAKEMTFRQCAEAFIKAHESGWRNDKHRAQWPSTLETYVYPVFGKQPVQAVDTALVMRVLEPIWTEKPETASRVRGRIESVLDWARARGHRAGENPARWKGHLDNLLPQKTKVRQVRNFAALPYRDLPAFMAVLDKEDGIGALALKFTILTASRTGAAIGARWQEIDLTERVWTTPGERMKTGREHRVPLSAPVMAILGELKKLPASAFVFPATARRPVSNMIMLMLLRRIGRGDLTAHGFRSTFSDWCAETTNFPAEVREMALAHAVGDKVEAAYRRGDLFQKRRQVMDAWARFATTPLPAGEVVPIAGASPGREAAA